MPKSTISEELTVTGNITGTGTLEIQGTVLGDVRSQSIDILSGGRVEGNVTADVAHVRGHLKGSLSADAVDLYAKANVDADVTAGVMSSEKGARVVGKVDIGSKAPSTT
jgi:cytoskeletal protein CcmA (bactofilin family)